MNKAFEMDNKAPDGAGYRSLVNSALSTSISFFFYQIYCAFIRVFNGILTKLSGLHTVFPDLTR
jgi:hypothetical protein